jgi:Protein of unknown function (DUF3093)
MHGYRERLSAPISWWITGMVTMFTFGSIVWFGFPLWVAVVTYAFCLGVTAAFLLNWGRATIEVTGTDLTAGGARLPLTATGEVRPLNEAQTTALRGPRADPRAHLLIRPYLRESVYVEVTGGASQAPYWLLATRHPARLAAAIELSRVPAGPAGPASLAGPF